MQQLVSEKITLSGFFTALVDILIMAMFLIGMFYCANEAKYHGDFGSLACVAVMILLFAHFTHYFMRLMNPMRHYDRVQIFRQIPPPAQPGETIWKCGFINLAGVCLCDEINGYGQPCPHRYLIECPVHNEVLGNASDRT